AAGRGPVARGCGERGGGRGGRGGGLGRGGRSRQAGHVGGRPRREGGGAALGGRGGRRPGSRRGGREPAPPDGLSRTGKALTTALGRGPASGRQLQGGQELLEVAGGRLAARRFPHQNVQPLFDEKTADLQQIDSVGSLNFPLPPGIAVQGQVRLADQLGTGKVLQKTVPCAVQRGLDLLALGNDSRQVHERKGELLLAVLQRVHVRGDVALHGL